MAQILSIVKDGSQKTQIMYKANLSFTQLKRYLTSMLASNLITQIASDGKEEYFATEQGMEFFQKHNELIQILNANDNTKKTNQKQKGLSK